MADGLGATRAENERPTPVDPRPVEQGGGGGPIGHHGGAKPPVERRGQGQLVARVDLELIGQGGGLTGERGLAAQELVDRGQLAADPRGLAPRRLDVTFGRAQVLARRLHPGLGAFSLALRLVDTLAALRHVARGLLQLLFELGQLAGQLGLAVAVQGFERGLERGDPARRLRIGSVGAVLGGKRLEERPGPG